MRRITAGRVLRSRSLAARVVFLDPFFIRVGGDGEAEGSFTVFVVFTAP
jgi:hypothetical protein